MIEITYHKRIHSLEVKGHAGGKRGNDIVCAAVSTLTGTLAQSLEAMKDSGIISHLEYHLDPGDAEIRCIPKSRMANVVQIVFTTICIGLERVADQYPQKVSYKEA